MSKNVHRWSIGEKANKRDVLFDRARVKPCHYCHKLLQRHEATLDHVTPWSEGGSNDSSNLVLACNPCNQRRGSMSYFGFLRLIGQMQEESPDLEIKRLLEARCVAQGR
ncbi:MAG: HNH endonuclease [Leptothrix sp. (in: b-proteobacteria)]